MSQLVSLQQAARNALAQYLTDELAPVGGGDGVVVEPRWFEKDRQLPPRAITIINAGPRSIEWTDPEVLETSIKSATQAEVTWALGYATQPLQLDVWALEDLALDDIVARLDRHLNVGQAFYRETVLGIANTEPFGVGVLLELGDGWESATADFVFDAPDAEPGPDEVMQGQWRAMFRGNVNLRLVQKATSSRMARIHFKQRLRTTDAVDATAPYDTTTIDANT